MQIAPGESDICEFESYMPSHAVVPSYAVVSPCRSALEPRADLQLFVPSVFPLRPSVGAAELPTHRGKAPSNISAYVFCHHENNGDLQ
jgi:hypothetical protein